MKTKITILFLCLVYHFSFGQTNDRKSFHGQVLNDSIQVSNGYVVNLNAKTRTFISADGYFDILAKARDTLLISSLAFKPRKIILSSENFTIPLTIVKLETYTNHLKEVIVQRKINLNLGNIQKIIDTPYFDDGQSSPKNTNMPTITIENGLDFMKIGGMIGKLFIKNETPKKEINFYENFKEAANKAVTREFFTNTLKLKKEEVGLFLIFCESDPKSLPFLKSENKFQLIDFLVIKNKEFNSITTIKN